MQPLSAADAASMSRQKALRTMATAEGVPARDRRIAELMLAGPDIDAPVRGPMVKRMVLSVHLALQQYSVEVAEQRAAARGEVLELGRFG